MQLENLYLLAAVMVVFVLAFTEVLKVVAPNLEKKYLPLCSLGLGLFVGLLLFPFSDFNLYTTLVSGLISGLIACGAFDLTKVVKK